MCTVHYGSIGSIFYARRTTGSVFQTLGRAAESGAACGSDPSILVVVAVATPTPSMTTHLSNPLQKVLPVNHSACSRESGGFPCIYMQVVLLSVSELWLKRSHRFCACTTCRQVNPKTLSSWFRQCLAPFTQHVPVSTEVMAINLNSKASFSALLVSSSE